MSVDIVYVLEKNFWYKHNLTKSFWKVIFVHAFDCPYRSFLTSEQWEHAAIFNSMQSSVFTLCVPFLTLILAVCTRSHSPTLLLTTRCREYLETTVVVNLVTKVYPVI